MFPFVTQSAYLHLAHTHPPLVNQPRDELLLVILGVRAITGAQRTRQADTEWALGRSRNTKPGGLPDPPGFVNEGEMGYVSRPR
jgi:hypothetical protein